MVLVISRKKLRIESAKVFFVAICEREREGHINSLGFLWVLG